MAPNPSRLRGVSQDCAAGLVTALLQLSNCYTFAALIFSGPWQPFLAHGLGVLLVTSIVTAAIGAGMSGFPVAIAGPISSTSALLAAMLAPLGVATTGSSAIALATGYAALGIATVAAGAFLLTLGTLKLGRAVRFVPYPVIAGFMGATGWVMVDGAVRMSTGVPLRLATLPLFASAHTAPLLAGVIAFAVILYAMTRRFRHALTIPLSLLTATLAAHAALYVLRVPLTAARASGYLFEASGPASPSLPLISGRLLDIDWSLFPQIAAGVVGVAVVAVVQALTSATSLELAMNVDADLDRELRFQGVANIASALLGGIVGLVSVSYTTLNTDAGARGRAAGCTVAVVMLAALALGGDVIGDIPCSVLGGMLLMLGARLLWDWGIASRHQMSWHEWLLAIAVIAAAATIGFLPALVIGVIGGCVLLAISMSRLGIIRRCYGANEGPSSLQRPEGEMLCLAARGGEARMLELGGFIFFGSAYRIYEQVKALLDAGPVHAMALDFSAVTGIDASAVAILARVAALARKAGLRLFVSGLDTTAARVLRGAIDPTAQHCATLDEALEAAENVVLAVHDVGVGEAAPDLDAVSWLTAALGDAGPARELAAELSVARYRKGDVLCRQGEDTDALLFVESGRISVMVDSPGRPAIRVRLLGRHTVVGELAFLLGTPRSATLLVERDASVGALDRAAFARLSIERPDLTSALLQYLVRVQAERLLLATNQITALRR